MARFDLVRGIRGGLAEGGGGLVRGGGSAVGCLFGLVGGVLRCGLGFVLCDDFLVFLFGVGGGVFGFGFGGFCGALEVGAGFFFDGANLWERESGGVLWWREGGIWGGGGVYVRVPHYPQHHRQFSARFPHSRMLSPDIPSLLPCRRFFERWVYCRRLRQCCRRRERSQ